MISASTWFIVVLTIIVALAFDVINGFHDAANSIATVVSTRVLSPRQAVTLAATFNFVAILVFPTAVAKTIEKIVHIDPSDPAFVYVVLAALVGAIVWDLLTWLWGLPTSSSHALIGGLVGAGMAHKGIGIINWEKVVSTIKFIPLAPVIAFTFGYLIMVAVFWIFRRWRPLQVDRLYRRVQLFTAAMYSLGHGGNDAQKTMGIVVALLVAAGILAPDTPLSLLHLNTAWIVLACGAAMAIGTAFGGWRIVKTMGMRLTKLRPVSASSAETAGALTLFIATHWGIPVSTTHTITGAIVGVGSVRRTAAVRWGIAGSIVWAWVLTIPCSALIAAAGYWLGRAVL